MEQKQRTADAVWQGDSRSGGGKFSTGSGALHDQVYTWNMRFGEDPGTNPEELIAAAHAACYSMALASDLKKAGFTPDFIRTHVILTMEKEDRWSVRRIHLDVEAKVPNMDEAAFQQTAEGAKDNCPISRLLAPGLLGIDLTTKFQS